MRTRIGLLAALLAAFAAALTLAACGDGGDEGQADPDGAQLGFNEVIVPGEPGYELLAESGASFVRVAINWASAEPEPGELVWGGPDAITEELAQQGLKPLWVVTSAPCWAAQLECSRPEPGIAPRPDNVGDYAAFITQVAERYPDSLGIEVWNEPNLPQFWRPEPDPGLYRELLAASADAVHESGSEVPVVMGGPSPVPPEEAAKNPEKIEFASFIEEVMSGEDAPDVDAIGTHPYSLLVPDEDPIEVTLRFFEEAAAAAESAAPGVPVWVTETGLTTEGRSAVSVKEQAEGLGQIFAAMAAAGVPVITVHRFFDQQDPPFVFEEGFGVVEADRSTPKESFCALAEAAGAPCEG